MEHDAVMLSHQSLVFTRTQTLTQLASTSTAVARADYPHQNERDGFAFLLHHRLHSRPCWNFHCGETAVAAERSLNQNKTHRHEKLSRIFSYFNDV